MTTMGPLVVDLYSEDANGHPDMPALVSAGLPWAGVSLKISQGLYYNSAAWLKKYWPLARQQAGDRYGKTFFRQGYHYLSLQPGQGFAAQAQYCLKHIELSGGIGPGDLPIGVDVEEADNPPNPGKAMIEDGVSEFAAEIEKQTGQKPICYGGSYLRDNHVTSHMGCVAAWVACYEATLPPYVYESIGYPLWRKVFGWQYCGTEAYTGPAGYPEKSPCGHTDISTILIDGGGDASLDWMRAHVPPENPDNA